uniref:NADH-ubiquinone oxidoreductase chain 2 n=1 Tax=Acropyga panamensis TaxID=602222 RepID=A0A6G5NIQ8_9HYME|nr:NADH dehydrogenase subunit 2 [Acropyga panamensis]QBG38665.1 NADH dehydrogenase subunit 2 [Acropyga panamensis]
MIMNNMFYKFFILSNLINFSFMPLFIQNLLMIWFMMEINNFLFICYLCFKFNNKKLIFMYYIIQIIASLFMIFSLIFNNFFMINMNFLLINFYLSMMIKLGIPPFHLWMPMMSHHMNWNIIFIFLSIQKIIPFYLMSTINIIQPLIFYYLILSSTYISTFKMINLLNIKMLLIYSSINQTGWMLFLILLKNMFWLFYLIIYSLILWIILFLFSLSKFSMIFFMNKNIPTKFNLFNMMMIFNLASLPPLSFFFMKWMNIYISMFNTNLFLIFILLMINSLIMIYIYINMMIISMFFYLIKLKFFHYPIMLLNKNYLFIILLFLKINMSMFIFLI